MNSTGQRAINTRDEDIYLLPQKAFIEVRGQLMDTANPPAPFAAGTEITLLNNGWGLFRSARYQLASQTIEDITKHLPVASTIINLVSFSEDYSRSTATNMFWVKDTATGEAVSTEFRTGAGAPGANDNNLIANSADPADLAAAAVAIGNSIRAAAAKIRQPRYNEGYAKGRAFTDNGVQVTMFLPLSGIFGFCRDVNKIFRSIKHTVILNRTDNNNIVFRVGGADEQFVMRHLSLWMPKVAPSITKQLELEESSASFTRQIYFEQNKVYRKSIPATESYTWRVTTSPSEQLPLHVFVVFQTVARANGDQTSNKRVLYNLSLTRINTRINSRSYPEREMVCDFNQATRNVSGAYLSLMESMQKYQDTDTDGQISIEEFRTLYQVFHFDVSKHSERLMGSPADIGLIGH